jgi:hypothetical protein
VVDELRSRAGTLISAAAITTSFFGSQVLNRGVPPIAWVAIGAFVALGFSVLMTLWPRHDWQYALSASKLIATYVESSENGPQPLAVVHRDLALHMDASAAQNGNQLRTLMRALRIGALLLMVEVVAWVVALARPHII